MCTVSFIPAADRVFLTSNRDEKSRRLPADPPDQYGAAGNRLLYPKDRAKGGTWIAVNSKGDAGVLLNGAREAHVPKASYSHSRGIVLPQLLGTADPMVAFSEMDLSGIEPFTLVMYVGGKLFDCRWDGHSKSINRLPEYQPHVWSSSTLYDAEMQETRKSWFEQWVKEHPLPDTESIFKLHRYGGEGNSDLDYVMNRNNETLTVSITSIELQKGRAVVRYHQLGDDRMYRRSLIYGEAAKKAKSTWWQKFSIRLFNWEYWPFTAVYGPIYPYWLWLGLKARSLFFFAASNPTIRNGGFLMESKKEIYDLLPEGSYPRTVLINPSNVSADGLEDIFRQQGLSFPLIAKPDIGMRGLAVKLLRTIDELEAYHQQSRVDYLLQDYVPYENEAGIFFCRFPGNKEGTITGIVGKELLRVTGDGIRTVEELLSKEERAVLQLEALRKSDPSSLSEVLPAGKVKLIVPYGNHSRGAKFIDLSHLINEDLSQVINRLCLQVKGFYFGRLDIRYNSWEELCEGKAFSVIELNGAGSEPAHIYDPKHSIFFGWKEIIRHWNLLYHISKQNRRMKKVPYLSLKEGIDMFRDNAAYIRKIS